MSANLQQLSHAQGGRGVALKNFGPISQSGVETPIGQSPGAGTGATLILLTNHDTAYDNATINWYARQFGRRALISTTTIEPTDNANFSALAYTVAGFAADYWELTITLTGGTTPAAPLQSSVEAFGVEDIPTGLPPSPSSLSFSGTYTGPSAAGAAAFSIPAGVDTYIVTITARVLSSAVDPVGASFSTSGTFTWKNVAGTVSLVPIVLSAPNTAEDSLFATMSTAVGVAGTQAQASWVTPAGLDASTVVKVSVRFFPLASG